MTASRPEHGTRTARLPSWLPLAGRVYYGWVLLGAVSATELVSWGILYYTFAVLVAPMERELGWSRLELSGAFSLALLVAGLAAVPVGRTLDRHGPRALMTAGSALASALLVAWSRVEQLWLFYAIMGGIGLAMAAVLYEPAFQIVAVWFRRRRGRALTVLTFWGALASAVFVPLSSWLVATLGWRSALLALAGILAGLTIPPHALLLRRRPEDFGLLPDGADGRAPAAEPAAAEPSIAPAVALRQPSFWTLAFALAASTFALVALTVHLLPYLLSAGYAPAFAAGAAGLFGLTSLAGRLVLAPLGDRYRRGRVTAGLLALQLAGLVALALAPGATGVVVGIALFGAGAGTLTIMRAALLAERYGPAHYGSINGAVSVVLTLARTLAPIGAGALIVSPGGYAALWWTLGGLLVAGCLAMLLQRDGGSTKDPRGTKAGSS